MTRRPAVPAAVVVVVLGLGGLAGCGSDDGGGDAEPDKPAVCESVGALKSATADLKDLSVRADGIGAIQDQIATLRAAYADVRSDAGDEFGPQLDTVDADLGTVKDGVAAVAEKPDLTTIGDLGTGIRTLVDDVTTLVDDVQNTC